MSLIKKLYFENVIQSFFFIRYNEDGPHLRFRFLINNFLNKNDIFEYIDKELFSYIYSLHIKFERELELKRVEYIAEVNRYGGTQAIEIAENQFALSSRIISEIFQSKCNIWDYDIALGFAIKIHITFIFALKYDINKIQEFCLYVKNSLISNIIFKNLFESITDIDIAFQTSYKFQEIYILQTVRKFWDKLIKKNRVDHWVYIWVKGLQKNFNDLEKIYNNNRINKTHKDNKFGDSTFENFSWPIYASYIHMTNNRLGIKVIDEPYVFFLIINFFKLINQNHEGSYSG